METQKLICAEGVFDQLQAGKLCTIRKGRRDIQLGDLILESLEKKRTQLVTVYRVIYCALADVPDEYYHNDGFESVDDMRDQMRIFYPDIDYSTEVTVVEFKM